MYNPWSILKYIQSVLNNEQVPASPYWCNTNSDNVIRQLVDSSNYDMKMVIESLLEGEVIIKPLYTDIIYKNISINSDYIWSLLLYNGYIKPINLYKNDIFTYFDAVIPNIEVWKIYQTSIIQCFYEKIKAASHNNLYEALLNEDDDKIQNILIEWLSENINYFDEQESNYNNFLCEMLSRFKGFDVKSNHENSIRKSNLTILEKHDHETAIIIEIKVAKKFADLEKECAEALRQIDDNNYQTELIGDCYKKIIKYGIAFHDISCMVKLG